MSLISQYLEIIEEEMDLTAWNFFLCELITSTHIGSNEMSATVLCLLRGQMTDSLDDSQTDHAASTILHEYDIKLSAAGAELTTPILKVIDQVIPNRPWISGLVLQNSWLYLYVHNCTCSHTTLPFRSAGLLIAPLLLRVALISMIALIVSQKLILSSSSSLVLPLRSPVGRSTGIFV